MATGRVEFPDIRPVGQTMKRMNTIGHGLGLHQRSHVVGLMIDSSLMNRLPATISSDSDADHSGDERERPPGRRRLSQPSTLSKSLEKRKFIKRMSTRNLIVPPRQINVEDVTNNHQLAPRTHRAKNKRLIKQSSSFRLNSLQGLAEKHEPGQERHDRRDIRRDGSDDERERSCSLPRIRSRTLPKQMSLLSLRSKQSSTSLLSDDGDGDGMGRRNSIRSTMSNSRRRRTNRYGDSSSRGQGGRYSKRSHRTQLRAIAASPNKVSSRFRKAIRLVQLIIRSFQINQKLQYSRDIAIETAGLVPPTTPLGGAGISFDPSHYKAKKEGQLNSDAKRILTKPVSERTPEEVQKALVSLRNSLDVFCEFPIKMQQSLAKFGWYNRLDKRRLIVRQGHRAENFFLVLSGTALVTMTTRDERSQEPRVKLVNFLRMGNTFGERELMQNMKRPHTIVCQEEVEILTIDKEEYVNIFMEKSANSDIDFSNGIASFLRGIDVFREWPIGKLPRDNPAVCLLTYFRKGTVICRDSNAAEWIYVIKSGACNILKELKEPKSLPATPRKPKQKPVSKRADSVLHLGQVGKLPPIIKVTKSDPPSSPAQSVSLEGEELKSKGGRFYNAAKTVFKTEVQLKQKMKKIDDAEDHLSLLDTISVRSSSPRLANLTCALMETFISENGSVKGNNGNSVFLKLHRCVPGDVFGLATVLFRSMDGSPSLTMTSEGAECILISKSFFLQHLSEPAKDRLLRTVPPWPPEARLQELLQQQFDWDRYKSGLMDDIVQYNQKIAEGAV